MWRGVSVRKLAVLLFAPMLSETLSTLFSMWMVERSIAQGYEPRQHMLIPTVGSLGYAISAFVAGRWVTPRVAPGLMVGTILALVATGLSAMVAGVYPAFIALNFVMGLALGHYYTPFQINMTHVRPFRTLAWSIAFYNIAWGIGGAAGFFFASWLVEEPLWTLGSLVVGIAAVHTLLNVASWYAPPSTHEETVTKAFSSTRRQRRLALAAFVVVGLTIRGLAITLWPEVGEARGWTGFQKGIGPLSMFLPVAWAALIWARLRYHLHKPWIMLGSMVIGLAGFGLFPLVESWAAAVVCVTAVGLMESCVVFHAIYYMNADPDPRSRGRNVGMFEMFAGLSSILGPLALGLLAWDDALSWPPYVFGCAGLLLAIILVVATHREPVKA